MTAVPLLDSHKGCHCRKPVSPVASFFRRAIAAVRRRLAVPAAIATAGAATTLLTPPDGQPVLRDRMLSEVRAEHDLLSTAELAALHPRGRHPYPAPPVRLPRPGGEIVIDERGHVSVCPWPAAQPPAFARPPEPERADVTSVDLNRARPYVPAPAYGQAPVARVLEAERLAGAMRP
jgi:hypothetical protein